jgi:hypothetical protein
MTLPNYPKDRYQVITINFKDWQVCEFGKVIAVCKGRNAKLDAERVGSGLIALEQVAILSAQLSIMADVIREKDLWQHFKGIFVKHIPKEGD